MLTEPIAVTLLVTNALDAEYSLRNWRFISGAVHGVIRATMDADIVADLRLEHITPLVNSLGDAFYADAESARQAIRRRASFNFIHLETMFKSVLCLFPKSYIMLLIVSSTIFEQ